LFLQPTHGRCIGRAGTVELYLQRRQLTARLGTAAAYQTTFSFEFLRGLGSLSLPGLQLFPACLITEGLVAALPEGLYDRQTLKLPAGEGDDLLTDLPGETSRLDLFN
jgi:hypothetical protein